MPSTQTPLPNSLSTPRRSTRPSVSSSSTSPSPSYNDRLTPLSDKGLCGDPEYVEPPSAVRAKATRLAILLRASHHTVVFTGAGVSTASGIPDFRGPQGLWTLEAAQATVGKAGKAGKREEPPPDSFSGAVPSFTHLALVALHRAGLVQHVVTQNVDNLHVRSGLPRSALTELHGNIFVAHCTACRTHRYHQQDVGGMGCKPLPAEFACGRCGGECVDDAVDWTTPLPRREFARAESELRKAALCVVLGSSLRVSPASGLPSRVRWRKAGGERGSLVVVNLQATHLDAKCALRVWGRVDDVMRQLCDDLALSVGAFSEYRMPPWTYGAEEEKEGGDDGEGIRARKKDAAEGGVVSNAKRRRKGG